MIIDEHVHLSDRVSKKLDHASPFTAEMLLSQMDGPFTLNGKQRKIDISLVMPLPGVDDENIRLGHRYILESCKKYPKRMIGCAMINPWNNIDDNLDELENLVRNDGFRMIKLHPTAHGYRLTKTNIENLVAPVLEKANKLRIPVLIHTGDPFAEPIRFASIAEMYSDVTIILAHFGTQMISYAPEAIYVAKTHENVLLETGWAPQARLKDGVKELGPEKLVFGSDSPMNDAWSWLTMIASLIKPHPLGVGLKEEDIEKIMGANLEKLLGAR